MTLPAGSAGLRRAVDDICAQLCAAVDGSFGFRVGTASEDHSAQRLAMLANFALAAAEASVEEARDKERELREAHRVARIGTWRHDLVAGSLQWSEEMHKLVGTDPANYEPSPAAALALVHPEDRRAMEERLLRLAATGGTAEFEWRVARTDGSLVWFWTELGTETDEAGRPVALRGVCQDITERKTSAERIHHLAHYDPLTGLANRALLQERLERDITGMRRGDGALAVLCLDLDGFKAVNDLHGHGAGDRLLRQVAERLRAVVRETDLVARLGGDEFVIVQPFEAGHHEAATCLAERVTAELAKPYDLGDGQDVSVSASVGISLCPQDAATPSLLMANADTALYRVKRGGRNGYAHFRPEMDEETRERRGMEQDLRLALPRGELSLVYQPQAQAGTGEVVGFEALLRWNHPARGGVRPDVFIPVAEATGTIVPIGNWVLREACAEAARWPAPLRIAVNVSPAQIQHGNLPAMVAAVLAETGLDPARLEIEVTESLLMQEGGQALGALQKLRALGVRVAMDDFGTGYSSLATLRAFPFDKIKLDRGFVRDIETSEEAGAIMRAVLGLGRGLGLPVVAEGVETAEQAAMLTANGCDEMQGYWISRPQPISAFAGLIRADYAAPSIASSAAIQASSAAATSRPMAARRVLAAVTSAARPGA